MSTLITIFLTLAILVCIALMFVGGLSVAAGGMSDAPIAGEEAETQGAHLFFEAAITLIALVVISFLHHWGYW